MLPPLDRRSLLLLALAPAALALGACVARSVPAPAPDLARDAPDGRLVPDAWFEAGGVTHVPAVAWSRDGATLWAGTDAGEVLALDAATGALRARARIAPGPVDALGVAASGHALALAGERVVLLALEPGQAADAGAAPDAGTEAGAPAGRALRALVRAVVPGAAGLAPDRAGARVAVWGRDGLVVLDAGTLAPRARLPLRTPVLAADWAAGDAALVAAAPAPLGLLVLDPATLAPRAAHAVEGALEAVACAPDRPVVAVAGATRGTVDLLDLERATRRALPGWQPFDVTAIGWAPDGERVAAGDASCDLWLHDVARAGPRLRARHHVECRISAVAWAPDGARVVFGCRPAADAPAPATWDEHLADAPPGAILAFRAR